MTIRPFSRASQQALDDPWLADCSPRAACAGRELGASGCTWREEAQARRAPVLSGCEHWQKAARAGRIALVGPTAADVRDVMVEGESGILAVCPNHFRPIYEPSKRRLTWPNGAVAQMFSSEEPDRLRGPQFSAAWCDELAAWRNVEATWNMLQFGLRLGKNPRQCVTTTPRPIKLLKELVKRPDAVVVRGSTYDNRANLAPSFFSQIVRRYEGTRLGRQELNAELLEDTEGALWNLDLIEASRKPKDHVPDLKRIVIALDPAVSVSETSDATGIVVAGIGHDGRGYVLDDLSGKYCAD